MPVLIRSWPMFVVTHCLPKRGVYIVRRRPHQPTKGMARKLRQNKTNATKKKNCFFLCAIKGFLTRLKKCGALVSFRLFLDNASIFSIAATPDVLHHCDYPCCRMGMCSLVLRRGEKRDAQALRCNRTLLLTVGWLRNQTYNDPKKAPIAPAAYSGAKK